MSQSRVVNLLHLVYSTKHREPWLVPGVRDGLFRYQAGVFKKWDSPAILINGVEDHVHALFSLSKNHALVDVVEAVKSASSGWLKRKSPSKISDFYWQAGYAAFSVSQSNVEAVRKYIADQERHHRKMTFQDELRALYVKHGLKIDERYMWD